MRELILHIGRHKTGTTAIQHFLGDNRELLRDYGFLVPKSGLVNAGHHAFSRPLTPPELEKNATDDPQKLPAFRQLRREHASDDPTLTTVISSEAFQNCDPRVVRHAFRDFRTRVVVYLRNQVDYLASAYVQRVHATDYAGTIEAFYRDIYVAGSNYFSFLRNWGNQFPDDLRVRRYRSANIVADFREHALGLADAGFEVRGAASNPSLNSRVAAFKREFNSRNLPDKPSIDQIYYLLPQLNEYFPAEQFRVPGPIREALVEHCRSSDAAVAVAYFGDEALFDYDSHPDGQSADSEAVDFDAMYEALKDLLAQQRARKRATRG